MMKSEDIRQVNRIERNIKRLDKMIDTLDLVYRENEISGLDILYIQDKLKHAAQEMRRMHTRLLNS